MGDSAHELTMGWCVECHRAVNDKGVQASSPWPTLGLGTQAADGDDTKHQGAAGVRACHH